MVCNGAAGETKVNFHFSTILLPLLLHYPVTFKNLLLRIFSMIISVMSITWFFPCVTCWLFMMVSPMLTWSFLVITWPVVKVMWFIMIVTWFIVKITWFLNWIIWFVMRTRFFFSLRKIFVIYHRATSKYLLADVHDCCGTQERRCHTTTDSNR